MIDRNLCKAGLHERRAPPWPCPTCGRGTLCLDTATLRISETRASRVARNRDDWFWDDITERFAGILICDEKSCQEPVSVAGTTYHEPIDDGEGGQDLARRLRPLYFAPPLRIISLPSTCPKETVEEIEAAFLLFWTDLPSAANRVRTALERLLTQRGIPQYERTRGGRRRLTLHRRIELFRKKKADLGDAMLAVKWIGNEGSHPGRLTRDDLLDAFQLIEHLLDEMFVNRNAQIAKISREVLKQKGPRSKVGRKRKAV
jgi:hypothetical protein